MKEKTKSSTDAFIWTGRSTDPRACAVCTYYCLVDSNCSRGSRPAVERAKSRGTRPGVSDSCERSRLGPYVGTGVISIRYVTRRSPIIRSLVNLIKRAQIPGYLLCTNVDKREAAVRPSGHDEHRRGEGTCARVFNDDDSDTSHGTRQRCWSGASARRRTFIITSRSFPPRFIIANARPDVE